MKITDIKPVRANRFFFVQIETDEGITGLGEGGAFGALDAVGAHVEYLKEYLIGKDPLDIEHHWQVMFRGRFFRGSVVMAAISAIDIALWDIAGKYYHVPVYRLLGGPVRSKVRCYAHVFAKSDEEMVANCRKRMEQGFTAVGHLSPFLDEPLNLPYEKTHVQNMIESYNRVKLMRETVGDNIDLCIEMHRRMTPGEAIQLINKLDEFDPLFVEDPIPPGNNEAMAEVKKQTRLPIATGERLHTIFDFENLLEHRACHYVRTSITTCGGITGARKIAAMAEAKMCQIIPHNPLTPVATAASLQVCACVDNLLINEFPDPEAKLLRSDACKKDLVKNYYNPVDGYITLPTAEGIGIELADGIEKSFPPESVNAASRLNSDGSVRDQ